MIARRSAVSMRVAIDLALLGLAVASVLVIVLHAHGATRILPLLLAVCFVPGGAAMTLLPRSEPFLAVALAIGVSLTLETLGALAMIWTGFWHPVGWAALVGGVACLVLARDLRQGLQLGERARVP